MENISTGVFDRNGRDEISDSQFYAALTLSLMWGLVATALVAYKIIELKYNPGVIEILLLGLGLPILGIVIAVKSDNPIISFIGYNLIVIPFGIILGPVINQYSANVVRNAFGLTAAITFFMGFMGTCFPVLFRNLGAPLFLALGGLILVRIAQIFIPAIQNLGIIDYISAGVFSLYIGYDMYRANEISKTIDNAIDISVDLYLDVVNLFLNLLRILGSNKND
jgi:FtsH-binding integral membrane protein